MNEVIDGSTGEVVNGNGAHLVRLPQAGDGSGVNLLKILEERAKLLERILDYAIAATHTEQWFDLGGKAWPSGPACESMARRCGVSITNVRNTKRQSSDDKGDFYIYVCEATASLPSGFDSIEAFGTCSSRDTFLGTETSAGRAMSEIDEGNIMKAAYTNMLVNAVTRLLGVRNLSWERLGGLGLDRSKMGAVKYNSGAKGGGQQAAGANIELKFGKAKGKTIGELTDAELVDYLAIFEKDLANPEKEKYRSNTEKQIAAVKAVQASRANAKAGTETKAPENASPYERIKALFNAANYPPEKRLETVKRVTQTDSAEKLTEAHVKAIADALQVWKSEQGQAGGEKW